MSISSARPRSRFLCAACGADAPRWAGRCPECDAWNTLTEAPLTVVRGRQPRMDRRPAMLAAIDLAPMARASSGFAEVDRVLGGGFVPGSVVLLGGDPGVGKSTLALQAAQRCAAALAGEALYCSGEETAAQIAGRAARMQCGGEGVAVLVESDLDAVTATIESRRPVLAVVDSVQTLSDAEAGGLPGTPGQVRAAVARLVACAKASGVPIVVVGHVTKEGAIAGPRTLEHMVDVVLYLEGDRLGGHRLLRGVKNRFGSTGELGLLAMEATGFRDLDAPGRAFVDQQTAAEPGNALTITCDGLRPLAVQVQALTVRSAFAVPRRTASGVDISRLHLLLAVLERRASLPLGQADVYVNAVAGARLDDPATDLAVALALAGGHRNRRLPASCAVIGELGLGGEVRRVGRLSARLGEAAALGVATAIVPAGCERDAPPGLRCRPVATLAEALAVLS